MAGNTEQSSASGGVVDYFRAKIRASQGDGVSIGTHRAMKDAGVDPTDAVTSAVAQTPVRDDTYVPPVGATITMPDGRKITALQYQKLQQMLLNRR
jgi:hypothetical protein